MKWYVVNVFNGKEKSIKEKIKYELKEQKVNQFVNQLLTPKEKYVQIRKGKQVKTERNYFPGYIFIECEMNRELISVMDRVNGVIGFLGPEDNPTPMTEKEISNMISKVKSEDVVNADFSKLFSIDEHVDIIDGPFREFKGQITKIDSEKKRVTVNVKIFNRKTPVELSYEQIVKL